MQLQAENLDAASRPRQTLVFIPFLQDRRAKPAMTLPYVFPLLAGMTLGTWSALLRSDLHFGRRSAHIGVNLALELHEIVLEHRNELARGVVELGLVLPSLVRIEQVRLDARELGWH